LEAVVFFIFFGLYIVVRVLIGGGESAWENQKIESKPGLQLFDVKDYKGSKSYFEKVVKIKPFESLGYVILGEIALIEKEDERALYYAQKAIRLDNTVPDSHLLMSKGLYNINEFEQAIVNAQKAVWFGRAHIESNRWLGKLLVEKGEIKRGIRYLEIAFSKGDEDAGYELKSMKNRN